MHKIVSTSSLALALIVTAVEAYSQQNTPPIYSTAIYLKVLPEKEAAFVEFYKTGAGAKVIRARLKADPDTIGWSLRSMAYGGDPAPQANFAIVAAAKGAPKNPDPAKRDELYRAASGMNYAEYMQKVRSMSEQIGQTISHVHHMTDNYTVVEGDVVVATRLKTSAGKANEMSDFERDFRFPMSAARVKDGRAKAWSYSHFAFPGGELPYDATEATVYQDLASAMPNTGTAMEAFAKQFPGKDYARYISDRNALSKVVRTDVYRVVVSQRP
jgi:hypothetical protein